MPQTNGIRHPTCETCDFFERADVRPGPEGYCHARPPQVVVIPGTPDLRGVPQLIVRGLWCPVGPRDWCGRHQSFLSVPIDMPLDIPPDEPYEIDEESP